MDTMGKSTIKAQLVPTAYCRAHWIITFSEFGECINANLSGNTLHYTRHHLAGILDTIEFRINDGYPPIDELKGYMWLPDHLMQRQEFCRCVEWGVIWRYAELGCIEKLSTDGIPLDKMLDKLLERQGPSRSEEDNGQEVRSVRVMYHQPEHQEAEE